MSIGWTADLAHAMFRHLQAARLAACALALAVSGSARAEEVDANRTPGSVDGGTIDLQADVGQGKPPSGVAPLSSVGVEVDTGGVVNLFLADDESSVAGSNTAPGAAAIISMLLMACAENDPIDAHRGFGLEAIVETAKTSTDLGTGRQSELRRQIRHSFR
jgi:hypothetical protein